LVQPNLPAPLHADMFQGLHDAVARSVMKVFWMAHLLLSHGHPPAATRSDCRQRSKAGRHIRRKCFVLTLEKNFYIFQSVSPMASSFPFCVPHELAAFNESDDSLKTDGSLKD